MINSECEGVGTLPKPTIYRETQKLRQIEPSVGELMLQVGGELVNICRR